MRFKTSHFATIVAFATIGCGPLTQDSPEPAPTCVNAVDAFKELIVVDDAVMNDDAAKNQNDGALSFRFAMEALAGSSTTAQPWTAAWWKSWTPPSLQGALDGDADLSRAPFRLIAIANRVDLSEPAGSGSAEGRLVFAVTDGPGDDPSSAALPITVIVELDLPGDPRDWAVRWHALGTHAAFDADYMQSLTSLTTSFVRSENFAQIRVNDGAENAQGVLYEFHLSNGVLVPAGLRKTPPHTSDGSAALDDFLNANQTEIIAGNYDLPASMLASEVTLGSSWRLPGVGETLRNAFAAGTCDGCHGAEHPIVDAAFHISPFRSGADKLSRFLFDPGDRADDELTRRAAVLSALACAR